MVSKAGRRDKKLTRNYFCASMGMIKEVEREPHRERKSAERTFGEGVVSRIYREHCFCPPKIHMLKP